MLQTLTYNVSITRQYENTFENLSLNYKMR